MKLSKNVEDSKSGECLDRISSLPEEVLGNVLSRLPTRCAVSTSVLSTRWRYLFTLTSCLTFDDAPCFAGSEVSTEIKESRQRRFKEFVHKVLELQVSPIKKFSLVCKGIYDESDSSVWVNNAVQKGVQDLHHQVIEQKGVLPEVLFMCETLVRLKMIFYRQPQIEIPLSARLPKLKILHLECITFLDYNSIERLFCSCELLEELTLKSCDCDTDSDAIFSFGLLKVLTIEHCSFEEGLLVIDAPNLEYLTYSCNNGVKIIPSWKHSCSLVKAELEFHYSVDDGSNDDYLPYDSELLKAAANKATKLHLLMDSVELLLKLVDHKQMPDFRSLSRLQIFRIPYEAWKNVTSLLEKSPQLETVIFEEGLNESWCDLASPPNEPLNPFSCYVKVIEVNYYCGTEYSLLYLGHLLRNAGVLKRLIVHTDSSDREEEEIRKDLLMLPKASKDCCIEIDGEVLL